MPEDQSIAAHLLRLRDPGTGAPLPDDLLAGEFGLFFTAGLESAGNAISWTVYAAPRTQCPPCWLSVNTRGLPVLMLGAPKNPR